MPENKKTIRNIIIVTVAVIVISISITAAILIPVLFGGSSADGKAVVINGDLWDGTADTSWYRGNMVKTYDISTAEQLAGFAQLVNCGDNMKGVTINLLSDIVLNEDYADYEKLTFYCRSNSE